MGMVVDPRSIKLAVFFPEEWYPFVNSIHLQLYWGTFQVTPDVALANGYKTWGSYGRPLFPILQGYKVDAASVSRARTLAVQTYKSVGLSYCVFGQLSVTELAAINHNLDGSTPITPPGTDGTPVNYGQAITVSVGAPHYSDGAYQGVAPALAAFQTYSSAPCGTGKYPHTY